MAKTPPLFRLASIPVGIGLGLAVLLVALTFAYILVPDIYRGALIFFGAGLAAIGAIATAFYTGKTLEVILSHHQREPVEKASRFVERWNEASMFHSRKTCQKLIKMRGEGANKIKEEIEGDDEKQTNVAHVLNFLEELALSVHIGSVDGELSKRMFAGIVINIYHVCEEWIREQRRKRGRPQLWAEIEWLYKEWSNGGSSHVP